MKLLGRSGDGDPDAGEVRRVTGSPGAPPNAGGPGSSSQAATPVSGRLQRLAEVVDRGRARRTDRDLRKILQLLGMLAIVFGFVCILLGWYGAAHSPYQYEEIPYVISGGLLGVALVIGGGVLILCAWSLRQVEEARRNAVAIVRSIDRLERALDNFDQRATGEGLRQEDRGA